MNILNQQQIDMICGGIERGFSLVNTGTFSGIDGITGVTSDPTYQNALRIAREEYLRLVASGVDPQDALADGLAAAGF